MANNLPSSKPAPPAAASSISAEALIGIGMTVAWLGLLCVMLGWAQWLRRVPEHAWIWLGLGVVLLVGGGFAAMTGNSRKKR
jgi:hypothetical protein